MIWQDREIMASPACAARIAICLHTRPDLPFSQIIVIYFVIFPISTTFVKHKQAADTMLQGAVRRSAWCRLPA